MLHIVVLSKNYFPDRLNSQVKAGDKVIILALPDGAIPVSAYKDDALKGMEVRFLPQLKDANSQDAKNTLRLAQALLIGQLTASEKDFAIYTDDSVLLKAVAPFTGKKTVNKKSSPKKAEVKPAKSVAPVVVKEKAVVTKKAEVKTKPAKLPTQAEVKRVLGAVNSAYAKPIMEVIKKSNQITFEMDLRMKLVEAGMEANQCKELARSINEEFGKMLPASM